MKPKGANPSGQTWAIQAEGITKSFGSLLALRGVDLRIEEREFVIIFGPNGAGKSTLIKVFATLYRPSSGTLQVAGFDLKHNANEIRRRIGVVAHLPLLYDELTAYENLKFYGRMYDVPHLEQRIQIVSEQVEMTSRLHDRVRTLSRGMQQRFSIARALLHEPQILLLDEPETGLDQEAAARFRELLNSLQNEGRTIVMTTHSLERGLSMGRQVVILVRGKVVFQEAREALNLDRFQETYLTYTGGKS